MSSKFLFSIISAICIFTYSPKIVLAASATSAPALKIAVVDLNKAMNDVEEGKTAIASLEKRFNDKRAVLEKKRKELEALQDEFEKKSLVMSEDSKKSKAKDIQEKYAEFEKSRYEAEQEMQNMRAQMQEDLGEKLKKTCSSIAQKQGYTLIVEKSVVWYSASQYDITNEVIQAYNAQPKASKK